MRAMDILEAMGNIPDPYILEARRPGKKKNSAKRALLIAAVIAALLALVGCAAWVLSLMDLSVGSYPLDRPREETVTVHQLSLQGYLGTPGYRAAKEWTDYSAAQESGEDNYLPPQEYEAYDCRNPEMEAELQRLSKVYSLELLGPIWWPESPQTMIEDLFLRSPGPDVVLEEGYCFESGTYQIGGTFRGIRFSLRCVRKTDFDHVTLAVGNPDDFRQELLPLEEGGKILAAQGEGRCILVADLPGCFVTVNALPGDQPLDPAELAAQLPMAQEPKAPDRGRMHQTERFTPAKAYAAYLEELMEGATNPDYMLYSLVDLDGDGMEEMLVGFLGAYPYGYELIAAEAGELKHLITGGDLYLCQGNVIEQELYLRSGEWHLFFTMEAGQLKELGCIRYCPEDSPEAPWLYRPDCQHDSEEWKSISRAEYEAFLSRYPRVETEWLPITQLPEL